MTVKLGLVITTIFSLLVLEHKFPFFTFENSLRSRVTANFSLGAINSIVSSLLTIAIARSGIIPQIDRGLMTIMPSPIIAVIISVLILDLYMYLWHRSMHIFPLAWRFHRLHHTDRSMNVSTAYRFHPLEIISSSVPKLILIWLLGIPSSFILIYELVFTFIVALHHSNLNVPASIDRILAYAIVTPNYHRIHHSQVIVETNSNYGSVFPWWDRIFHTQNNRPDIINIKLGVPEKP